MARAKAKTSISGHKVTFDSLEVHWITLRDKLAKSMGIKEDEWRDYVPIEDIPNSIRGDQLRTGMYDLSNPNREFVLIPR